jgi:hypothetical protein
MDNLNFDELRIAYKQATEEWVEAIRAEEALATSDHSEAAWDKWDTAGLAVEDAQAKAEEARDAFKDALREVNLGF